MIMILTGKAKEDFKKWKVTNDYIYVTTYSKSYNILENALIIEWLDSIGIFVEWDYGFETRQEATEKAIEKANKIYNETKA